MGQVKHTICVCVQENWCSRLPCTSAAPTGILSGRIGAVKCRYWQEQCREADFGARKDSRDLSDWATDLLSSLLPTLLASFSKANSSSKKTASLPSSHLVCIKCKRTGGKEAQCYFVSEVESCTVSLSLSLSPTLSPTLPYSHHPPIFVNSSHGPGHPFIRNLLN